MKGSTAMSILASAASTATPDPSAQRSDTELFEALVAEHNLIVEERDLDGLDESLRDKFFAFYVETRDRKIIIVPAGQDPAHRLAAVRALLAHPGVTA